MLEEAILQYFGYGHLPQHLQEPSKRCSDIAFWMVEYLPAGAERSAGLRKLLEAKDCFVRAALDKE
jgi:hypothetical protein